MDKGLPLLAADREMSIGVCLTVKLCYDRLPKSGRMGNLRNFFRKYFLHRHWSGQREISYGV